MRALISEKLIRDLPHASVEYRDTKLIGFMIRCRPTGSHSYSVRVGAGRAITIGRVGVLTPLQARTKAQEILRDRDLGVDVIALRRTAKAIPEYATFLSETYAPWARQHLQSAEDTIRRLTVSFASLAHLKLSEITPFTIERWRTAKLKAGLEKSSVNRELGALKGALSKAVQWGILSTHPIASVKPCTVDRQGRLRFLSPDEETRLRDALDAHHDPRSPHLKPLVLLALNTGLRRGELFGLEWRDVIGTRVTVRGAKTKNGQTRSVPLNSEAVAVLEDWQRVRGASRRLFTVSVRRAYESLLERAGIHDFTFHDLRHTFASKLVQSGQPLYTVSQLLGHSTTKMSEKYAHLAPEHLQAAVETLVRVG